MAGVNKGITIAVDTTAVKDQLTTVLRDLPKKTIDVVLMRTINRTGDMGRTQLIKDLAKSSGARAKDARRGLEVTRATMTSMTYTMTVQADFVEGLFNIQTLRDGRDCIYCRQCAFLGPYKKEDIPKLWKDQVPTREGGKPRKPNPVKGLLHWGCTCVLVPTGDELRGGLAKGGLTDNVTGVINANAQRIFAEEYKYALAKVLRDKGLS